MLHLSAFVHVCYENVMFEVNRYFPEEDASKKRNASEDEAVYTNYKRKRLLTDDRLNIIKTPSSLLLGLLSPVKDIFSPTKMGAIQYNMGSSEEADKGMKGRFREIQESLREGAKFVVKCNNRECLDQTQKLELQLKEKDKLLEKQRRLCICSGRANESPWSSLPLFIPAAHKDLMNTTYTSGEIYPLTMSAKKKPFTLNDTKLELPVRTIKTKAAEENKTCICGLTILNKELFVISQLRSEVEVYDSMEFNFRRRWNLSELVDPIDIGSCNRNKCLYIVNSTGFFGELKEILKVDSNTKLIKTWSTGDDIGCLSVTDESTVILTVCNKNKLNEYSPDGELIREINLSSDAGIRHPLHAIKLSNGHFVVSHGSYNDELRRVCLVDADGKLKKSFGGKPGSIMDPMSRPSYMYLSVDGSGCVLVLDERNSRIFQLDSDLEFKQDIFSREVQRPLASRKIILDESNGRRLFVAGNDFIDGGQILIFQLK